MHIGRKAECIGHRICASGRALRDGRTPVPSSVKEMFCRTFKDALILSAGYDAARAEGDLGAKTGDLIAVGRPFLANPDLVERWKTHAASIRRT
jgi:2,4-dienoyl-CoA reductase-like NADH-dependent reductase (Old Yellow Enzyme family)